MRFYKQIKNPRKVMILDSKDVSPKDCVRYVNQGWNTHWDSDLMCLWCWK